ncbi:hypothetical protein D9M72_258880 [compost metagenome]
MDGDHGGAAGIQPDGGASVGMRIAGHAQAHGNRTVGARGIEQVPDRGAGLRRQRSGREFVQRPDRPAARRQRRRDHARMAQRVGDPVADRTPRQVGAGGDADGKRQREDGAPIAVHVEQRAQGAFAERHAQRRRPLAGPPDDQARHAQAGIGQRRPGQHRLAGLVEHQGAVQAEERGDETFVVTAAALFLARRGIQEDDAAPGAAHPRLQGLARLSRRPEGDCGVRSELRGQAAAQRFQRRGVLRRRVARHEVRRVQPLVQGPRDRQQRAGQAGQDQDPAQAQRDPAMAEQPQTARHDLPVSTPGGPARRSCAARRPSARRWCRRCGCSSGGRTGC